MLLHLKTVEEVYHLESGVESLLVEFNLLRQQLLIGPLFETDMLYFRFFNLASLGFVEYDLGEQVLTLRVRRQVILCEELVSYIGKSTICIGRFEAVSINLEVNFVADMPIRAICLRIIVIDENVGLGVLILHDDADVDPPLSTTEELCSAKF